MRTATEIATEIAALKALKPMGAWAIKTMQSIQVAIEELEFGVDDTAEEWHALTDTQRDMVLTTRAWKQGHSNDRPSEGWGDLVEQALPPPPAIVPDLRKPTNGIHPQP